MASFPHADLARRYCVSDAKFRLSKVNPGDTADIKSKDKAVDASGAAVTALCELQELLYAQNEWSVLLLFQAMDAAGKDGTIKHVLSGVNPQGCRVATFKAPSPAELSHDFLWRASNVLPHRGEIGVFNRSYYEEVLVVRVHPEFLEKQGLPKPLLPKNIWAERFQSINDFERHLTRSGTVVLKFFLHVSPEEQRKRLLDRLDEKEKNWKFEKGDLKERKLWGQYMTAYEQMVQNTATEFAPWYVVPADHKWFTRLVVSSVVIERMRALGLRVPVLSATEEKEVVAARAALKART